MTAMLLCDSNVVKTAGKRSAGKLHAAFDEGDQGVTLVSTLPSFAENNYSPNEVA